MPESFPPETESSAVFRRNNDLFKRKNNAWEFFYKNSEVINDIEPMKFGENEGIFLISDNKITRWTNYIPSKKVYLRVRDNAGNESDLNTFSFVSLDLQSIKDFMPVGRILDVDEYGNVTYSFDSIDKTLLYAGDRIDTETGVYESEIFNGSNQLVSWRSIIWDTTEPTGTGITIQVRSAASEDDISSAAWSDDLIKNSEGYASVEYVKDQFIQFRAILISRVRDLSPTLHKVTIRNLTSSATHFFTTNFILPKKVISGILTENSVIPVTADIIFGLNTNNSVNFSEYQIIEPNRIYTTESRQFGSNLRIGVKLITPGFASPISQDPYNENTHSCSIAFEFTNTDTITKTFQFRIKFYSDVQRLQEVYSFFTGNNQTGWSYSNSLEFPAAGISIASDGVRTVTFVPGDSIPNTNLYYLVVEAFDGSNYEDVRMHDSFVCSTCDPVYDPYCEQNVPILKNFAILFSLEDGEVVKINL